MHTSSASLLERLRRPANPEAWAQFVRLDTPLLDCYWARRVGLQQHDDADLAQDVFAVLFQGLRKTLPVLSGGSSSSGYPSASGQ
jgi:hypothetical protein